MDQLWPQHAPAGRRPSLAPAGGGACHQWRGCRNAEGHGEPACEGVADYKTAPPSSSECDPRAMRIIALLLAVVAAVLCGCVGCEAPADLAWTLEHQLSLLSTQTARLLSVPCSSYAHTFRRDRYSATELLAAVRVARVQACSQGTLFAECGSPAEALDDASDWDNLVGRLQARGVSTVVRASPPSCWFSFPPGAVCFCCQAVLHALCQHAAVQASVGDNMARAVAAKLVNTAVRTLTKNCPSLFRNGGLWFDALWF
jgi:hypothetical protein